jgi:GNAT superfamily N-acetyltransferase
MRIVPYAPEHRPGAIALFAAELWPSAIQAHLSTIVVARSHRRRGVGRLLLAEALREAGGERMDVLSSADDFYAAMTKRHFSGWRLTRTDLGLE